MGKRGPKKGAIYKPTLDKAKAREALRGVVLSHMDSMLQAQIAHAKGIDHFFLRDPKTKQFVRIEDPKMIEAALNAGDRDNYYWIFTKDPSVQAFSDLMNRAIDKPAEQEQQHAISGTLMIKWKDEQ